MNIFYKIIIIIFLNGLAALLSQVVFYREIISQVYANELILGAILAIWLFAGAFGGSFIFSGFFRKKNLSFLKIALAIMPVISAFLIPAVVILIRYIKLLLGIQPEMLLNIWSAILIIIATASPAGMILTLTFSTAGEILRRENIKKQAKFMYIIEALGAMIAGIIFTLFLSERWGNFQVIYWLGVLDIVSIYILFKEKGNEGRIIIPVVVIGLLFYLGFIVAGFMEKTDIASLNAGFAKYEVIYNKEYPTTKLTICKRNNVYYVFENGMITYMVPDVKYSEITGWACLTHDKNSSVLNVNAGFAGMLSELSRYKSVEQITNIEADEYAGEAMQTQFESGIKTGKKIKNIFGDPVYFLKLNPPEKYDTIILNLSLPSTIYSNRYYTSEFFNGLNSRLGKGGEVIFYMAAAENYLNPALASTLSAVYNAAIKVFKNIFLVPGDNIIFICSNDEIRISAGQMLANMKKEGVDVPVLNRRYIEDRLNNEKQAALMNIIKKQHGISNSILKPEAYFAFLRNDVLMFRRGNNPLKMAVILFILAFAIANTFRLKQITDNPVPYFSMTAIGASAMIIELLLIFIFQSFYGYIYKYIGMIFAFFMLGCIIGGAAGYRFEKIKIRTVAIAAIILNLLSAVYFAVCSATGNAGNGVLVLLIIMAGLVAGLTFNLAIDNTEISMLYSMDLTGGAIAGLLFGVFLLPVLGVTGTIIFNIIILVFTAILNVTYTPGEIKIGK